jgi:pilus assembly protein CpaF
MDSEHFRASRNLAELCSSKGTTMKELSPLLVHILQDAQLHTSESFLGDEQSVVRAAERSGVILTRTELDQLLMWLNRERQSFGILQPLIEDRSVSDIIIKGYCHVAVQRGRETIATDYRFASQKLYEDFVERLLLRADATYSTRSPIADGMIDGSVRLHAVHKSIAGDGPYLTLRTNHLQVIDDAALVSTGFLPLPIFQYLNLMTRMGNTVVVSGEVATGKTTLAKALASSLPERDSIVVIEDTPEIRIAHPHVRYLCTRDDNSEGAGKITPTACIKAGMRMAMNRLIVGEIRDAQAADAFIDACASGHPGITTIHGKSPREAVLRLQMFLARAQQGSEVSAMAYQVAMSTQVVVQCDYCAVTKLRRVVKVSEVGSAADGVVQLQDIFSYRCDSRGGYWQVDSKLSRFRDKWDQATPHLSNLPDQLRVDAPMVISSFSQSRIDGNPGLKSGLKSGVKGVQVWI